MEVVGKFQDEFCVLSPTLCFTVLDAMMRKAIAKRKIMGIRWRLPKRLPRGEILDFADDSCMISQRFADIRESWRGSVEE